MTKNTNKVDKLKKLFVDKEAIAEAKVKKELIEEMSLATCLKKAYFECLSEEKFQEEVEAYRNRGLVVAEPKEEVVTISLDEYSRLLESREFLNCLEACGVDNWDGYGDAHQMLESPEDD